MRIGIITYGSVLNDPGQEIQANIVGKIFDIITPFKIEFARKSTTRGNAPTLTCVDNIGSQVKGAILELDTRITMYNASDLLWRRETRQSIESKRHYSDNSKFNSAVKIETISGFLGFDCLVYAKIDQNIDFPNPNILADLAIESVAQAEVAKNHKDGISYLFDVKSRGIKTPLLEPYENEILKRTGTNDLIQAYEKISNLPWSCSVINNGI